MGIPYYFRYLVRNHPQIFSKRKTAPITHFLLDSNSIVYDVVRALEAESAGGPAAEHDIIRAVIAKIDDFIALIKPSGSVVVAFDGVAPLAKLKQQKQRRYKSMLERTGSKGLGFDTTQITPGTPFMVSLNAGVRGHFARSSTVLVSGSDEPGEGEHKLFRYLRAVPDIGGASVLVYGLDADLIMLSLAHLPVCPRIYLYRDKDNDLIQDHFLDIAALSVRLGPVPGVAVRTHDYLLLSFFLGNDFMPKIPALCIRTEGINRLMEAYAKIGQPLTDNGSIVWRNVRALICVLAKQEHAFLLAEYTHRRKQAHRVKQEDYVEMHPSIDRVVEEYIAPEREGWQARYYQTLLKSRPTDDRKRQICVNWLQGVEWCLRYYVEGCPDWGWTYNYEYAPLLEDLATYAPYFDTEFIEANSRGPVTAAEQLAYVMPRASDRFEIQGAFCKYAWESHVCVPRYRAQV